jgi:hypothetical protein
VGHHPEPGDGAGPFRNVLGAVPPQAGRGQPDISLRFNVQGGLSIVLQPASGLQAYMDLTRKRLKRRGWSVGEPYQTEVLGLDGRARLIKRKKKGFRRPAGLPEVQSYAMVGPYALTVTVPQARAELATSFGSLRIDPAPSPIVTPVVQLPAPASSVEERLTITQGSARLNSVVVRGPVPMSTEQFVAASLGIMQREMPNLAVGDYQPDVFLGGWPCVRQTFVHGGAQSLVRSEFWWAGVVAEHGIQVSVSGTKAIISQHEARELQSLVALIPSA